jgi:peptidoglycan hydrolase-like protein with peptidoglycan-binding domain
MMEEENKQEDVVEEKTPAEQLEEGGVKISPEPAEATPKKQKNSKNVRSNLPANTFVAMSALVYLSVRQNSASVAAVQTRLLELGYVEAGGEKKGWFGPLTCQALKAFQEDAGIDEENCAGRETIEALFAGTRAEVVD